MIVHLVGSPDDDASALSGCGGGATILARNTFSLPYITPVEVVEYSTFDMYTRPRKDDDDTLKLTFIDNTTARARPQLHSVCSCISPVATDSTSGNNRTVHCVAVWCSTGARSKDILPSILQCPQQFALHGIISKICTQVRIHTRMDCEARTNSHSPTIGGHLRFAVTTLIRWSSMPNAACRVCTSHGSNTKIKNSL